MATFLVTGGAGFIGSNIVDALLERGDSVRVLDNFSTGREQNVADFRDRVEIVEGDIRDRATVDAAVSGADFVIHQAALASVPRSIADPTANNQVNVQGTLNLLEAFRTHTPDGVFIHLSTNKVYGDGPNQLELKELETRWDYADPLYANGIPEEFPIDHCLHSLFGVSKTSGDLLAQEYGRYFGLNVGVFRGGCLTGPFQSGVELHGFLNYLVRQAVTEGDYTIFGYGGKQVRDQIHSSDVVSAFWHFAQAPRKGEVYNIGGGVRNAASVLECIDLIEKVSGRRPNVSYSDENRIGDHICYYSDLSKFRTHYPEWDLSYSLEQIVEEVVRTVHDTELV